MDAIQIFHYELHSLLDSKPPVSRAKMGQITKAAMKGVKFYKHIVPIVEKFIAKCSPEYKIPGLYVIDSIVRQSRHQFGPDRDVYAARFSRNLQATFSNLFARCSPDDRPKIVRVLNLWQKNGVYNSMVIQPLLDMANPNSSFTLPSESTQSAESPGNIDIGKQGQTSKYRHYSESCSNTQYNKNSSSSMKVNNRGADGSGGGLRFSKNMLDFDYGEEDDDDGDETPTEAELPLSSFLSKIEMEERSRSERVISNNVSSQLQQPQTTLPQPSTQSHQQTMLKNDQDPVLERWNRLFKQQSDPDDTRQNNQHTELKFQRSRSRSPPVREKLPQQKERTPPQQKSPPVEPAERDLEKKAVREKKCLPEIRDKHLTVCSSTLWLGHVPKTVSEADISDAFGEYGTITSIDLIPPRGCAYVCMDRRQDAKRALSESKDLRLNGSHIKMAWAPGKGFKEYKKLKEFWEVDIGSSYIPYNKIDDTIDFDILEEGGLIDEDSMSMEMRDMRERKAREKENSKIIETQSSIPMSMSTLPMLSQQLHYAMSGSNMNMPTPNLNMAPPNLSMPAPNLNMPAPNLSMPGSNLNITGPNLNMTGQNLSISGSNINLAGPNMNMPGQNMNMSGPSMNMPGSNMNLSGPNMNLSGPNISISGQGMNMSGLNMNMPGPNMNMSGSNLGMPAPNLNIPPPTVLGQNVGLGGIPFPPPNIPTSGGSAGWYMLDSQATFSPTSCMMLWSQRES